MAHLATRLDSTAAEKMYAVLVDICGASSNADSASNFIEELVSESSGEWRFSGNLGYGGKFLFPECVVTYEPKDETPGRDRMMNAANVRLLALKNDTEAQQSPARAGSDAPGA